MTKSFNQRTSSYSAASCGSRSKIEMECQRRRWSRGHDSTRTPQSSRPELAAYIAQEQEELDQLPAVPRPDLINAPSFQSTLRSRKKVKSPGPSGLTYDILQQLDPKVLPAVATALSSAASTRALPPEWFHLFVKPLCKKPGLPQIRPISLLETWTKLIDVHFNLELRRIC